MDLVKGLYQMIQFYEIYKDNQKVRALLAQLSWSIDDYKLGNKV